MSWARYLLNFCSFWVPTYGAIKRERNWWPLHLRICGKGVQIVFILLLLHRNLKIPKVRKASCSNYRHFTFFFMPYYTVCSTSDVLLKNCHINDWQPWNTAPHSFLPLLQKHTYIYIHGSKSISFPCWISPMNKQRCFISSCCQSATFHLGPRLIKYFIILIHNFFGNCTPCLQHQPLSQSKMDLHVVVSSEKWILIQYFSSELGSRKENPVVLSTEFNEERGSSSVASNTWQNSYTTDGNHCK